ncbi:MAG: phage tail protein [Armatimonadota bacterium]
MVNSGSLLTITPNKKQVDRALNELAHIKAGAPRAMASALNKTVTGVRTDTVKMLTQTYTVKQKDIKKSITIGRKASLANLQAVVAGNYNAISLINFKVRPKSVTKRRPKKGVTTEVKRGETASIPHAFIAPLGGKPQVTTRVGKSRLPIKKRFGPAVPGMMNNNKVADTVMKLAGDRLEKNLNHEISRIEKGYGK